MTTLTADAARQVIERLTICDVTLTVDDGKSELRAVNGWGVEYHESQHEALAASVRRLCRFAVLHGFDPRQGTWSAVLR